MGREPIPEDLSGGAPCPTSRVRATERVSGGEIIIDSDARATIMSTFAFSRRKGPQSRKTRRRVHRPGLDSLEARTLLTAMAVDDVYRLIQDQPFQVVGSGVAALALHRGGFGKWLAHAH